MAVGITPIRVLIVGKRHLRQSSNNPVVPRDRVIDKHRVDIEVLNKEISECQRVNEKLQMIAKWYVRASQSALNNSPDMLELFEDLSRASPTA